MDGLKDDLKWFGEGFNGFPKRLPEDCVEYTLYIINSSLTQKEILGQLELVHKAASLLTTTLLKRYIWQRDSFELKLNVSNIKGSPHLRGLTNYGDSVEDEWLIVYVLRELSKDFPALWIQVVDTDGEFLLIEAAKTLPRWLNPEIADNRVWINSGELKIIPLPVAGDAPQNTKTAPISRPLTLAEGQETISETPRSLIHSPLIEAEAFYRLRNYPEQIEKSLHFVQITIPRKLAHIIHHCPASIAPATESFYLRDPIALKSLQAPSTALEFAPNDLVTTSVRFTRVLYAQLKSQQFTAPIAWKAILADSEKAAISDHAQQPAFSRLEIGMKVTSGFEMLAHDPAYRDNRSVREIEILLEDLKCGDSLPTDVEIKSWQDSARDDEEAWLDINFEDFEGELAGKGGNTKSDTRPRTFGPELQSGFGDAKTQEDLKKLVQRFEDFLNDEDAGVDGAELDDMDVDNDDEDEDDGDDSDEEDKDVSFDENEFARMMREMMGMPPEESEHTHRSQGNGKTENGKRVQELNSDIEDDEDNENESDEIRKVMERIEAELNEHGALNLDPTPRKLSVLKGEKGKEVMGRAKDTREEEDSEGDSEGDVEIDFNLAKNLLESFKSQAGMAGPGGNLMAALNVQLPRNEDG